MAFVLEAHVGKFKLTATLHENLLSTVHQNIVDGFIFQQDFQRPETCNLIKQVLGQLLGLCLVQHDPHLLQTFACDSGNLAAQVNIRCLVQSRQVQGFQ